MSSSNAKKIHGLNTSKNKRKSFRISTKIKVEMLVKGLESPVVEYSANISPDGMFLATNYRGAENEKIHLRIIFKNQDSYFDVSGRIIWTNPGPIKDHPKGIGIEFVDLNDKQKFVIENHLKDYINPT